jgi:hypothetical protein
MSGICRRSHARGGRSSFTVVIGGCLFVVALALLAGASREFGVGRVQKTVDQSVLAQAPCCQSMGGLSVDPIASAVPGSLVLESEGWRIANTDSEPLVIKGVTINREHLAPVGCGSCGHVRRDNGRSYPVTVEPGDSVRIFGYALGDRASYRGQVRDLTIETDRGTFHYSPSSGVEAE